MPTFGQLTGEATDGEERTPAGRLGRGTVIETAAAWAWHRIVKLLWTEPPLGPAAVVVTTVVRAARELLSAFKIVAVLALVAVIVLVVFRARPLIRWIVALVLLLGIFVVVRSHGSSASESSMRVDQIRPAVGDAEQLVVVHAAQQTDTEATAETFEKRDGAWHTVAGPMPARLGRAGLSEAHREGDGTTPVGVFTMHEAFGIKALNGLALPYRIVGPDDWWVSDSSKPAIYNTWQTTTPDEHGNPTRWDPADAEHLSTFGTAYNYAAVIDYNRPPDVETPKPGNGSAIFLHVATGKPTSGCVAIASDALVSILKWLDPTKHPRIVIGTDRWMLETTPAPNVQGTAPGGFDRVVPTRVLDTRRASRPGGSGPLGPDGVLDLDVNRELDGTARSAPLIPVDATAIALNLTLTDQTDETYLTAYPTPTDGAGPPIASNVNASPGEDRANLVIVRRGDGGKVRIFNKHGSAHVVADIVGYISPSATGRVAAVNPYRIVDTRVGMGGRDRKLGEGEHLDASVPFTPAGATAVIVNVTATESSKPTWLASFAGGALWNGTSTVNTKSNEDSANLAIVPLENNNQISVFNKWGTTHLIVDVTGFIVDGTSRFIAALRPTRVVDTRDGLGLRGKVGQETIEVVVPGLPRDVTAVAVTVTAVDASSNTNLRVDRITANPTDVSNLNVDKGKTRANLAVVPVSADGKILIANKNGSLDLVVDVSGWFVP